MSIEQIQNFDLFQLRLFEFTRQFYIGEEEILMARIMDCEIKDRKEFAKLFCELTKGRGRGKSHNSKQFSSKAENPDQISTRVGKYKHDRSTKHNLRSNVRKGKLDRLTKRK